MTRIKSCTCKHEFQDQVYGPSKRVYNIKDKKGGATCTVCGKESR